MRPFGPWDLVDLFTLILFAGVEMSMSDRVPKWRRYWSCVPAAVSCLFLRLGDGWITVLMPVLGITLFLWNYATWRTSIQAETQALKAHSAQLRVEIAAIEAEIARMEREDVRNSVH